MTKIFSFVNIVTWIPDNVASLSIVINQNQLLHFLLDFATDKVLSK